LGWKYYYLKHDSLELDTITIDTAVDLDLKNKNLYFKNGSNWALNEKIE